MSSACTAQCTTTSARSSAPTGASRAAGGSPAAPAGGATADGNGGAGSGDVGEGKAAQLFANEGGGGGRVVDYAQLFSKDDDEEGENEFLLELEAGAKRDGFSETAEAAAHVPQNQISSATTPRPPADPSLPRPSQLETRSPPSRGKNWLDPDATTPPQGSGSAEQHHALFFPTSTDISTQKSPAATSHTLFFPRASDSNKHNLFTDEAAKGPALFHKGSQGRRSSDGGAAGTSVRSFDTTTTVSKLGDANPFLPGALQRKLAEKNARLALMCYISHSRPVCRPYFRQATFVSERNSRSNRPMQRRFRSNSVPPQLPGRHSGKGVPKQAGSPPGGRDPQEKATPAPLTAPRDETEGGSSGSSAEAPDGDTASEEDGANGGGDDQVRVSGPRLRKGVMRKLRLWRGL